MSVRKVPVNVVNMLNVLTQKDPIPASVYKDIVVMGINVNISSSMNVSPMCPG